MIDSSNEGKCPICGNNNECRNIVESTINQKPCWCENTEFAFPVDLYTRIATKVNDKTCICKACAQAYRKS